MREQRVKVNGIHLQVRDYEHAGAAIIFLHFSGANLMMWQRAVPFFVNRYRLVLVDLRGHGLSDKPATGYHMDDMAADLAGLMPQLQLDRAHIVGSSLGAEVGLSLAANYPERVLSLVCDGAQASEFGPYGAWQGTQSEYEQHVTGELERMRSSPEKAYPSVEALVEARRSVLQKFDCWNEFVEAMSRYGVCRTDDGWFASAFRKFAQVEYMTNYYNYRLEDYYRRVQCPVLMPAGKIEDEHEQAVRQDLCSLARWAQLVDIDGWDHPFGWLVDPDQMCHTISDFLTLI